jgi:glycosyltransferase involved in cell wall biosynthesis
MLELSIPGPDRLVPDGARRTVPTHGRSEQRARPALALAASLDRVRRAPTILAAIHVAPDVRAVVRTAMRDGVEPAQVLAPLVDAIRDGRDSVTGRAAARALGLLSGDPAEEELVRLLSTAVEGFDNHAAWGARARPGSTRVVKALVSTVGRGGLAGMHAQAALARWATVDPRLSAAILRALDTALREAMDVASRRYLVETVGTLPGEGARQLLEQSALDGSEAPSVRAEAIMALSDRVGGRLPPDLRRLAGRGGRVGDAVERALVLQALRRRGPRRRHERRDGLHIVQVHLAAILDAEASRAGAGDAGGLTTLLPQLGRELAAQPRIRHVLTIGRADASGGAASHPGRGVPRDGHRVEGVPLEDGEGTSFAGTWPSLVAAERGLRAIMLATGTPDVIHLRMADPGTLAAARIAQELRIPVVFTLAPDPHLPIIVAEESGILDRRSFGSEDARTALWQRVALVGELARRADELVLFPRSRDSHRLADLLRLDVAAGRPRHTVVAEGVDTRRADAAARALSGDPEAPVLRDLRLAISGMPAARRGLPMVISVGRLNEVKGMARLVAAFASDETLGAAANLVIVGGDLEQPSAAEAAELTRIHRLLEAHPTLRERVVLLGHRSHAEVAMIMAAARSGWRGMVAPGGVYACGSLKEEFGLAIVEAMAAGLPVVVPKAGGPATFVEAGRTGLLVDTSDPVEVASALRRALRLAREPRTAARARAVVDGRFTLERMARTLAGVYRTAAGTATLGHPVGGTRSA